MTAGISRSGAPSDRARIVVIAKAPVPGRVKTRLCPPCTPEQAARLAEAALRDTLAAVAATPARERVLALDGEPGPWCGDGFRIVPQRGDGLAERLASAFEDTGGPALLVGMDTPQIDAALLREALDELAQDGVDAVLGGAPDGGYWAIGLREADRAVFEGVPMSRSDTADAQRARLEALGLRWRELRQLRDVDDMDDARAVAAARPGSRFAAVLATLDGGVGGSS